ncbi:MAG: hypothetical protein V1728_01260 [Candidatus Micrarchaeota archaeon]
MITGIRIDSVEAKRSNNEEIRGLDVNIGIDNVKTTGQEVEVAFTYNVIYREAVGHLKMSGSLMSHEDAKLSKEISDSWAKDKKLPDSYSELVLNAINFTCGTNGVLVVRPVNLAPPMVPPRIEIAKGPSAPAAPSGRAGRGMGGGSS